MRRSAADDATYNYRMITLARESRGLSQTELSSRCKISQGKVSKVESGVLTLTEDEIMKVAEVLQYPRAFFDRNYRMYGTGLSEFYHRKKQSVSQKCLKKIYANIEIRRMELMQLFNSIDSEKHHFFNMDPDQFDDDVEEIASIVRATWRIPRGPITNVTEVIEEAGGLVIPFDFEDLKIDAISMWPSELPPLFFVNMDRPMDRVRFTLCHEIGHIIMHDIPPSANCNIEDQADRFAAEFLMPSREIGPSLTNLNVAKLAGLKLHWKVSMSALIMTAKNLGRISESKARHLWTQLSNNGYRTREPENLEPAREIPTLLDEIVQIHVQDLNYNIEDLSRAVQLSEKECKSLYLHQNSYLRLVD